MKSTLWIYAAAGFNVALALFHLSFWRIFRWGEELPKLHPVNRGVVQVMNLMLAFFFLGMAALQVRWPQELPTTALGRTLLAGMALFWIVRAALQPVFWRGQPAATNGAFVLLFLAGAGLHGLTLPAGAP